MRALRGVTAIASVARRACALLWRVSTQSMGRNRRNNRAGVADGQAPCTVIGPACFVPQPGCLLRSCRLAKERLLRII